MLEDWQQYQVTESALRALPNREAVYVLLLGDSPITWIGVSCRRVFAVPTVESRCNEIPHHH